MQNKLYNKSAFVFPFIRKYVANVDAFVITEIIKFFSEIIIYQIHMGTFLLVIRFCL